VQVEVSTFLGGIAFSTHDLHVVVNVLNNGTVSWPYSHSTLLQKCALAVPTGPAACLFSLRVCHFTVLITFNVLMSIAEQVLYST